MIGGSSYTGWSNKSHINYVDYLQGRQFEHSIRYAINDKTKQIIASNEQLAHENYKVLEHINEGITSGFTTLSTDISELKDNIDSGFQRLASIFEWGFSEMLVSLGRVNDSLDALIKIAKTPAQTWAYEQFEIARDEFRRGLYPESLESVLRAINGFGSNPGYKTEFRFHFLLGTIRLGSFKNSDPQIVDPTDAEAAFLRAARYAINDLPIEAARALLCAGRAAFTQRKAEMALKHSHDAIALDGNLAEAYFQAAQACCALGQPQDATNNVITSIVLNHSYAVKAASDGDICHYPDMLDQALFSAKTELKKSYDKEKDLFSVILNKIEATAFDRYAVRTVCAEQIKDARKYEKDFEEESSKDTIFGYVHAAELAQKGKSITQSIVNSFRTITCQLIDEEKESLSTSISSIDSEVSKTKPEKFDFKEWCMGGALLFILLLFIPKGIGVGLFIVLLIAIPLTDGLGLLAFVPTTWLVSCIRKMLWESKEKEFQYQKQPLRQQISELEIIKDRIKSFTMKE